MDFKFSKDEHINKEADGESLFDVVKQKIIKLLNYELLSKPLTKLQKIMIVIYGGWRNMALNEVKQMENINKSCLTLQEMNLWPKGDPL